MAVKANNVIKPLPSLMEGYFLKFDLGILEQVSRASGKNENFNLKGNDRAYCRRLNVIKRMAYQLLYSLGMRIQVGYRSVK